MKPWNRVAIVGVGLIGGSIGLGLVRRKMASEVIGVGWRTASLRTAKRLGAVTATTTNLQRGVAEADLVVVCTPVSTIVEQVCQIAAACRPGTLITDAGSTKAQIVADLEQRAQSDGWGRDVRFLGSHPLAGNEKRGPQHASADLLQGRVVVVTPTEQTRAEDCEALKRFWTSLGARVVRMSAAEHDRIVASTSHLPHLVAAAVAAATPEDYLTLAAGGWLDTTRIAAGDPSLWQQIFLANRSHVLQALGRFERSAAAFREAIEQRDAQRLEKLLQEAKQIRDAVGS